MKPVIVDTGFLVCLFLRDESGVRRILTTDRSDFSTFGLKGGKRFELIEWL